MILRTNGLLNGTARDLAYALRQLWRSPGFTLLVLAVLGSAIGLVTGLFILFDAMVLRPWPVPDADHVVRAFSTRSKAPIGSWGWY